MTDEQIRLVRTTWNRIAPTSDLAARVFYDRLFATNPEFRPLFSEDMSDQWRKLMLTISTAVAALDGIEAIVPALEEMGRRHATYGVRPDDYAPVGAALLWMLQRTLGSDYTPAVALAWTEVYTLIATVMTRAAAQRG